MEDFDQIAYEIMELVKNSKCWGPTEHIWLITKVSKDSFLCHLEHGKGKKILVTVKEV